MLETSIYPPTRHLSIIHEEVLCVCVVETSIHPSIHQSGIHLSTMEHQHHTDHPATPILIQARRDLDFLKVCGETPSLNYWTVITNVVGLFSKCLCAQDFLTALRVAWEASCEKYNRRRTEEDNTNHDRAALASLRLYVVSEGLRCLARQGVRVAGPWEDPVEVLITLVSPCDPDTLRQGFFQGHDVVRWILDVFTDPYLCPNVTLRLRLLLLVQFWWRSEELMGKSVEGERRSESAGESKSEGVVGESKNNSESAEESKSEGVVGERKRSESVGERIVIGLVSLSDHIQVSLHYTPGASLTDLAQPLYRILCALRRVGHLNETLHRAALQIDSLSVGAEARFVARLVELVSGGVALTREMLLQTRSISPINALNMIEMSLVQLRDLLFSSACNIDTYTRPGLCRVAGVAFITVARVVVDILPLLYRYTRLAPRCNNLRRTIVWIINIASTYPRCRPLMKISQADHKRELQVIVRGLLTPREIQQLATRRATTTTTANMEPEDCPER